MNRSPIAISMLYANSSGVCSGCGLVSVGGNVVQLCGSIVCVLGHGGLLYGAVSHRECSSDESFGKPPTALADQAYTGIVSSALAVAKFRITPMGGQAEQSRRWFFGYRRRG